MESGERFKKQNVSLYYGLVFCFFRCFSIKNMV